MHCKILQGTMTVTILLPSCALFVLTVENTRERSDTKKRTACRKKRRNQQTAADTSPLGGGSIFRRIRLYCIALCVLLVFALVDISSSEPQTETIQAQAFGTTTMSGRTFGITIIIEDYSTPA